MEDQLYHKTGFGKKKFELFCIVILIKGQQLTLKSLPSFDLGFQNTKWPAVLSFLYTFHKSKKPANLNYHISIKKSHVILKCFKDLEISIWFMPGSENKTMFCDT